MFMSTVTGKGEARYLPRGFGNKSNVQEKKEIYAYNILINIIFEHLIALIS
jgi:hypothetical protein